MRRRDFLRRAATTPVLALWPGALGLGPGLPGRRAPGPSETRTGAAADARRASGVQRPRLLPPRLRTGDTVGVVAPATATFRQEELDIVTESLEGLGLRVRTGAHVLSRFGSLAGADADRSSDINAFFADPEIRAIVPTRGGWGSGRLLPHLDYETIRRNPKILIGYSDITALLNGIHAQTGLVTFHGPNGGGRWDAFTLDHFRRMLFDGEALTLANPTTTSDENVLAQIEHRTVGIHGGRAEGRLIGGNLTVLTSILGSDYAPEPDGAILFLEDTGEALYRIDRMMTQLRLAGVLERLAGFVFGTCDDCTPGEGYASFTLEEVLRDHIAPLGIPAWQGAMIGHGMPQWTLPVGLDATIDADAATVTMTTPAVK
jgi:muramoyltetrapeptide carboxypeptidase